MAYTPKTDWKTGETLPANDMNRIEQGIADASISATWSGVTGKPTTYTPTIGTTATTAAAGNHTHAGLVTPTAAPTITITDPPDDENIQAAFNTLIAALKTAGVLT